MGSLHTADPAWMGIAPAWLGGFYGVAALAAMLITAAPLLHFFSRRGYAGVDPAGELRVASEGNASSADAISPAACPPSSPASTPSAPASSGRNNFSVSAAASSSTSTPPLLPALLSTFERGRNPGRQESHGGQITAVNMPRSESVSSTRRQAVSRPSSALQVKMLGQLLRSRGSDEVWRPGETRCLVVVCSELVLLHQVPGTRAMALPPSVSTTGRVV